MNLYQNSSVSSGLALKFESGRWASVPAASLLETPASIKKLSFASYNVLMNNMRRRYPITELLFQSERRYKYQLNQMFPELNADFLALSEITEQYVELLLKNDYIQRNYYISPIQYESHMKKHGVLLLSKLPFWSYSIDDICGEGRIRIALFCLSETRAFLAVGMHLSAYEENLLKR
jgi:hypothetical protein